MGYYYHWKPSKTAIREYAERMEDIESFCIENGITRSSSCDSYYFTLNGKSYRVSNHTIEASNRGAYRDNGLGERVQVREEYHLNGRDSDTIYITASKTRLIEIYNNLKQGKHLNARGYVIDK